jgi:UDP-2,3-diacylglucosamine pyrophosphatase LpxH
MRLIVISDIHIGSGPLDDFDAELEQALIAFLDRLAVDPEPTELVINGDFLDFAQAEPWKGKDLESETVEGVPLCFTEEQSLEKLRGIMVAHADAFKALGGFLSSDATHQLTILPGNHDADFFWRRVRETFTQHVTGNHQDAAQRLRFHLEQVYRPEQFSCVWIEHGHQYDDSNRFFVGDDARWADACKPILTDRDGVPRLLECIGTRFLIRFLNALDVDYPFVDNVKPFSKFVKMFLVSAAAPGFGPLKAALAYWGLLRFVGRTLRRSPRDLLSAEAGGPDPVREVAERLSTLTPGDAKALERKVTERGFDFKGMPLGFYVSDDARAEALLDFMCLDPGVLDGIPANDRGYLSQPGTGYLTLGSAFLQDETKALKTAACAIVARGDATSVVMGHTHEPVEATAELNYVNTGSWTRYYREEKGARKGASWKLLKRSALEHFPFEGAYALIREESGSQVVRQVFRQSP